MADSTNRQLSKNLLAERNSAKQAADGEGFDAVSVTDLAANGLRQSQNQGEAESEGVGLDSDLKAVSRHPDSRTPTPNPDLPTPDPGRDSYNRYHRTHPSTPINKWQYSWRSPYRLADALKGADVQTFGNPRDRPASALFSELYWLSEPPRASGGATFWA